VNFVINLRARGLKEFKAVKEHQRIRISERDKQRNRGIRKTERKSESILILITSLIPVYLVSALLFLFSDIQII
jgi:hypothetical protein